MGADPDARTFRAPVSTQNRDLPRAVAIPLLLFRMNNVGTMFRIRTGQPAGTLVHTILNAKHQTRGKSCIRDSLLRRTPRSLGDRQRGLRGSIDYLRKI